MWYNQAGRRVQQVLASRGFPETRPSLLRSLRAEDAGESWVDFFHCYAPAVMRAARFRGLDAHDADDVVQQVMLAISRHIRGFKYDRDRGRFRQWVRRIAESKIADHLRRRPPVQSDACLSDRASDEPSPDELWAQVWENEWRLQDIAHCLHNIRETVAPQTFEAFRMYVIEGMSADRVAAALNISMHHVHVIRCQILKRIKKQIAELHDDRP